MTLLSILGGGGHGSDVLSLVEACDASGALAIEEIVVADDNWTDCGRFDGRPIRRVTSMVAAVGPGTKYLLGIGYPVQRSGLAEKADAWGGTACDSLVHPMASVGANYHSGPGSLVFGQVWVSANVHLGRHVHVSYGSTIGHDCQIGAFTSIMPGANVAGDVELGERVLVGSGAVILEGLHIGEGATIGAGSVVTRSVAAGVTVLGVPARAQGR